MIEKGVGERERRRDYEKEPKNQVPTFYVFWKKGEM